MQMQPLIDIAEKKNCTVYALILAWIRHKSPCVVPIPGASKIESIENSVASLHINLNEPEMKEIDDLTDELFTL